MHGTAFLLLALSPLHQRAKANRVLTFDGFPATHDNNANLLSLEGDTYAWDVRNRLAALTGPGLSASFQYDALGRRTKKIRNGQNTEFMSDGVNPLQEQAVAGANWTALTMTGLGVDEIIARGDFSGTYYYLPDGLGSTIALTDGTGAIHTQYTYAPFGETTRTGTVTTNPFQFTGRENDSTGLYYYRARYYHPVLQRFLSEDPIEFAGGDVNLYAYVLNNPVNLTDPDGRIIAQVIGGGIGAVFGAVVAAKAGQDFSGIFRSALVGGTAGVFSTIPIFGLNPLLSGAIGSGITGFLGNVASQKFVEKKSLDRIDFQSASLSGLAGLVGGGIGGGIAGAGQIAALAPGAAVRGHIFTDFGRKIIGATIGGISAGGLDILFQDGFGNISCLASVPVVDVPPDLRLAGRGCK